MSRPKITARVSLTVLVVAGLVLALWGAEPLYWVIATEKTPVWSGTARLKHPYRGWASHHRTSLEPHGWERVWYIESGQLCWEKRFDRGTLLEETHYYFDGSICQQDGPGGGRTSSPPWRFGVLLRKPAPMPPWLADRTQWAEFLRRRR